MVAVGNDETQGVEGDGTLAEDAGKGKTGAEITTDALAVTVAKGRDAVSARTACPARKVEAIEMTAFQRSQHRLT